MSFTPWEELSRHEQLATTYSDMYKDVYGIRPRWVDFSAMTEEDIEKDLARLEIAAKVQAQSQREIELEAIEKFEAKITKMIAKEKWMDREAAIKVLMVKNDCREGDRDYLCFVYGLPYGYLNK